MKVQITENLKNSIIIAKKIAIKYSNPEVGTEHILYGLVKNDKSQVSKLLREYGVKPEPIEEVFKDEDHVVIMGEPELTARVNATILQAYRLSSQAGTPQASCAHVLLCMLADPSSLAYSILQNVFKVDIPAMVNALYNAIGGSGEAKTDNNSSLPDSLKDLGIDITQKARQQKIDPVIGRKDEIERIIQILCRKTKNNPVLIGEPGVGKSAVVEGLAKEIVEGNVPELLKDKTIFSLDIGSIIAGTKYRGAMEEKLKEAINAIKENNNIIVFIDELHTLAQAGGKEGEVSPADILKPYLARGELQTIGATTTDEYRKYIEVDKALERRFQPIIVAPPSVEDTIEILKGLRENYEAFHKVTLSDEAIEAAAKLSDRYIMDRFLPDKAIDLIDEAMSKAKVSGNTVPDGVKNMEERLAELNKQKDEAARSENYNKAMQLRNERDALAKEIEKAKLNWSKSSERSSGVITAENIAEIVAKWTKIPVSRLSETETQRLVHLEEILHDRVIGQDKAVVSVAKAIRRARAGLKDPNRPIGTFLFLGPTGVGKTELTKALSEAMFDDENAVIRLDMSEYMESHSVSKLIGSPPGYVGFDDGGQLTEQVRRKPYSVVLFDEIEKAHPDVYNLLLQLMDDGRLTDSQGRLVSFKNTIIIMTSNVGVAELKTARSLGFGGGMEDAARRTEDVINAALKRRFKPEFLNRIDVICTFNHLMREDIAKIADIMLKKVQKKLSERNIRLRVTDTMMGYIIESGYDMEYGARPLRRVIEQSIEDAIAEEILAGRIKDGDTVTADYMDGRVMIRANIL
ncbi:MAG: ATP-dependent Clp protease ATP-binding subunit [Clostridiales bacterium]|nr:ATP-dependent Clp protease ATP-binding subunit [Clostridiales bacterium]